MVNMGVSFYIFIFIKLIYLLGLVVGAVGVGSLDDGLEAF